MSVFKKNFLPSQSQPWARQVEDKLADVEARFKTEIVNNRTRDEQLQSSYNRLDKAVQQVTVTANAANQAIEAITSLGEESSDYSIYAGNISGGTITGITVQTDDTGTRVELSEQTAKFYGGATGILQGEIYGGTSTETGGLYLIGGSGSLYMGGGGVNNLIDFKQNGVTVASISNGVFSPKDINTGGNIFCDNLAALTDIVAEGNLTASSITVSPGGASISGGANISGGLTVGTINASGSSTFSSTLLNTGAPATSNAANVYLASNGRFEKVSSSSTIEVKENVRELQFSSEDFIAINPVVFDYKDGIVSDDSGKNVIGFIAEDFEAVGLADKLVIPKETSGDFKSLRYDKLYMFLHKVVQEQHETIKSLEARIEALESR